jgi:hypothetical protein
MTGADPAAFAAIAPAACLLSVTPGHVERRAREHF